MSKRQGNYRAIPEYYDPEYANCEWLALDVPFLLKHLPRKGVDVLELAAGTGRVAIPLAQAGHRVIGVDYDPRMLDIARRKRDAVGLGDRQLSLIPADVRKLELGRKFDWVCILFNTFLNFSTLEAQDEALDGVVRHLKPGGRFWIDIFQPNLAMLAEDRSDGLDPQMFYVPEFDRTVFHTTSVKRDVASQLQHITFHYLWFDAHGREHRRKREFDLTFIFPRELRMLVERHGLRVERMYGDYDGKPVNSRSPRIIAQCQLKAVR